MRFLMVVVCAAPLLAQFGEYAGPSILSRGGGGLRPGAPISFRPYINISGLFSNGLTASVDPGTGKVNDDVVAGGEAALGLYGYHGWKHTVVGLNYRGDYRRFNKHTYRDGSNQLLSFGVEHEISKHLIVTFREGAGSFTQNGGYLGTFGFYDPTFAQIPRDELLDVRTNYLTSMADVTYQKSARLSFNFGGSAFTVRRSESALYGVTGESARADAAYRLTRRTTIAGDYFFSHFGFNKAFGSADIHSVGVNYAVQVTRWSQVALRAGLTRVETLGLGVVQIDPQVAAIIGQTQGIQAFYRVRTRPSFSGTFTRQFRLGTLSIGGSRGVGPGNGIYLASDQNTASVSYSYTGMRRWSLSCSSYYSDMRSVGQDIGRYRNVSAGGGLSRSIGSRNLFFTARLDVRRYLAGSSFRRTATEGSVGFAYSPGDVPLRLW